MCLSPSGRKIAALNGQKGRQGARLQADLAGGQVTGLHEIAVYCVAKSRRRV